MNNINPNKVEDDLFDTRGYKSDICDDDEDDDECYDMGCFDPYWFG